MSQTYINPQYHDPAAPQFPTPLHASERKWQHLLADIRPTASRRLVLIGNLYILLGLLSIGLEVELLLDLQVSFIGCFVNGVTLFVVGVITLTLCRQQVYVLTSQCILVIIQMFVTIATFGFYGYFLYNTFDSLGKCFETGIFDNCGRDGKIAAILLGDLIHLFLTFCLIIVNFIVIRNVRRPPPNTEMTNYMGYNPNPGNVN